MSKSNSMENSMLLLFFNNTNFAAIGDATGLRGATLVGNLYVSLHTADPGEAGSQATSESAYTGYARVAVPRSVAGWAVLLNAVSNAAAVTFPACTGGTSTVTHFGIGTDASGAGTLLYKGALTASLAISNGITPSAPTGELDITED